MVSILQSYKRQTKTRAKSLLLSLTMLSSLLNTNCLSYKRQAVRCSALLFYGFSKQRGVNILIQKCRMPCQIDSVNATRQFSSSSPPWKVDTSVAKDVLLYRYDNPRFFRMLGFFGISQFIFWAYLTDFAATYVKGSENKVVTEDSSSDSNQPTILSRLAGLNIYKFGLTLLFSSIGSIILFGSAFYSLRAVRFLVLRKGGQGVTIVTYTPFGGSRYMEVPLVDISAKQSRQAAKVQLPVKVRNRMGHFIIDMRGDFLNGPLFDATAGLKRFA